MLNTAGFVLINCAVIKSARRPLQGHRLVERRETFDGQSSARQARAVSEGELLLFCQPPQIAV